MSAQAPGRPGPPERPARRRMGRRTGAAACLLVLATATVVAGQQIHEAGQGRRETIVQRFNTRHVTAARFVEAYVRQIEDQQSRLAARALTARVISPAGLDELARLTRLDAAEVYDFTGRRLGRSPSAAETGSDDLPTALAGRPVVAADLTGIPMVTFAVPFETTSGPRVFAGRYPVNETLFSSFVSDALPTYRSARVYLVDQQGRVIASSREGIAGRNLLDVAPGLASARLDRPGTHHAFTDAGRGYAIGGGITGTTWRLVFTLDRDELFETLTPAQRYWPWAALAGFVVMGLGIAGMFLRLLADRARAEQEHARQQAILDTAGDAFVGLDAEGRVTDWNAAAARLLGWSREEAIGRVGQDLFSPPAEVREEMNDNFRRYMQGGEPPAHLQVRELSHRDGRKIPVELSVSRSHWQGQWRLNSFLRDITERVEHERQLRELALTDSLTGLANRRAFLDALEAALARAHRHGAGLAVLYADVDEFKAINDVLGHGAGDAVLCQVAARLRAHFRTEDTVGRLGGDEFAVICEDFAGQDGATTARLHQVLALPYYVNDRAVPVTVSVGIAGIEPGEGMSELLERADATMYRAKAAR